jgi:hypothetical protein
MFNLTVAWSRCVARLWLTRAGSGCDADKERERGEHVLKRARVRHFDSEVMLRCKNLEAARIEFEMSVR